MTDSKGNEVRVGSVVTIIRSGRWALVNKIVVVKELYSDGSMLVALYNNEEVVVKAADVEVRK